MRELIVSEGKSNYNLITTPFLTISHCFHFLFEEMCTNTTQTLDKDFWPL